MRELDELDRLAAEKVMGWVAGHGHWIGPLNTPQGTKTMWQPTRNIAQAWESRLINHDEAKAQLP